MNFPIQRWWFFPVVLFISILCVTPLFHQSGMDSPLSTQDHFFAGITLFVATSWGIAFGIGHVVASVLTRIFPELKTHHKSAKANENSY